MSERTLAHRFSTVLQDNGSCSPQLFAFTVETSFVISVVLGRRLLSRIQEVCCHQAGNGTMSSRRRPLFARSHQSSGSSASLRTVVGVELETDFSDI